MLRLHLCFYGTFDFFSNAIKSVFEELTLYNNQTPTVIYKTQVIPKTKHIDFVRKQCQIYKNHPEILKTKKISDSWNSLAIDQKKARSIIKQNPYKTLKYFKDKRKSVSGDLKNVIVCLPPKSGSSSWEVLMVENLWNKNTNFMNSGVRPYSFNEMVAPSLLERFVREDKQNWNNFLNELNSGKSNEIFTGYPS